MLFSKDREHAGISTTKNMVRTSARGERKEEKKRGDERREEEMRGDLRRGGKSRDDKRRGKKSLSGTEGPPVTIAAADVRITLLFPHPVC